MIDRLCSQNNTSHSCYKVSKTMPDNCYFSRPPGNYIPVYKTNVLSEKYKCNNNQFYHNFCNQKNKSESLPSSNQMGIFASFLVVRLVTSALTTITVTISISIYHTKKSSCLSCLISKGIKAALSIICTTFWFLLVIHNSQVDIW
jgi:hypothetical protein